MLFSSLPKAPSREGIDLRCTNTEAVMAEMAEKGIVADLTIADPPWTYERQAHQNAKNVGEVYGTITIPEIIGHLAMAYPISGRLAMWITGPVIQEWMTETAAAGKLWPWSGVVTAGAWLKSGDTNVGHVGIGYHWLGCAEFVFVYPKPKAHNNRSEVVRNAWSEAPAAHSRKPSRWQAQWIRRWVPPGGLVLDVYAGLGSVAEAVLLAGEGRRYIGAEIDPDRHAQAMSLLTQVRA